MRITIVDDRYAEVYGAQENVLLLAEQCVARGHDVDVVTTAEGELASSARRRGLAVSVVAAPPHLLRFDRELLAGGPIALARTARHVVTYSRRLDRHLRATDAHVVVASAVRPALLLGRTSLRRRPRIVLWSQNDIPLGALSTLAALFSWRIGLISDAARCTFPAVAQRLFRRRFRPLPSGRDFTEYEPLPEQSGDQPLEILTVCSVTRRKRIDLVIESFAEACLPTGSTLTVVGGTTGQRSVEYLAELEGLAAARGVDVNFVGWQDDVASYLSRGDIFVLASDNEGLPGVLLEALAAGVACVTTRAGAGGELVERCGGGIAVDVNDLAGLTAAIALLASDGELRQQYAATGAMNVRLLYSLEACFTAFQAIIEEQATR